jgi:hypothetical protein
MRPGIARVMLGTATPLDAKHLFLISPEFGINFILISIDRRASPPGEKLK